MNRSTLILPVLLLGLCACGDRNATSEAPAGEPAPQAAAPEAGATPQSPAAGQTAAPPVSGHSGIIDPTPNSQQATAGSIDFDLPPTWQSQPPSSDMRLAQAKVPGPGGLGDLAVFYFGPGGGGPVDANIARWVGQMEGGGKPTPETFVVNGYKVTWVDVKGTLKPSQMGMGSPTAVPNARLFGAVVEGPGGPWFFKAQGPDATMAPQRDAFVAMLKGVRKK
jgi:hypothetical protein